MSYKDLDQSFINELAFLAMWANMGTTLRQF